MFIRFSKARAVLLLCASLFFMPAGAFSDEAADLQPALSVDQSTLSFSQDQSAILLPQAPAAAETRAPSTAWLFVRMVLVLAVVVALIYAVMRYMRRTTTVADTDDPFLRRVSSLSLGQGKSVQVVTLLDHAYLVGVSDSNISLIGEVADKELVDSMNLFADKNAETRKPRTFADVLELFMPMSGRMAGRSGQTAGEEAADREAAAPASETSSAGKEQGPAAGSQARMQAPEEAAPASSISRLRDRLNSGFGGEDKDNA